MPPSFPSEAASLSELLHERQWIRGLARVLVQDVHAAEDVAQDAWMTALRRPPAPGPGLRGWLRRVVRSRAIDRVRREDRRDTHESAQPARPPSRSPDALIAEAELQADVAHAVRALPEPYRHTVLLRYFGGLAAGEIASRLDVPVATVRARLARAHARLRRRLAPRLDTRRASALLVLAGVPHPGSLATPGAVPALATGVAMHTSQKLTFGLLALLLGLVGGVLGQWIAGPGEARTDDGAREAAMRADGEPDADDPDADASPTLMSTPMPDVAALLKEVRALRADVATLRERQAGVDPDQLARIDRILDNLLDARRKANETMVIGTSRNVISAMAQVQASARIDTDQDGTGEYGGFREMSGAVKGRMDQKLMPPVLARRFREMGDTVTIERSGYHFRIYLPGSGGEGIAEPKAGFANDGSINADLAETTWCLYAWPIRYGETGKLTFFTNQGGDVLATDNPAYSGKNGPPADAAFTGPGGIVGRVVVGVPARDGQTWKQVN